MRYLALASALVLVSLTPGAARAGDHYFQNGFNDEIGRIAAHAAVGVVSGLLYGPPPPVVYAPAPVVYAPPVYYAPPPPPPVYVVPVYGYAYPVYGGYPYRGYWGGRGPHGHGYGHRHH